MSEMNEMDGLLRAALQGRPEVAAGLRGEALARAAMERAILAEAGAARLAKVARWMRMASVAAGILLVVALAVGAYWFGVVDATASTTAVTDSVEGIGSVTAIDWTTVGGMVLGTVVVGLAVKVVMGSERAGLGYA